jgi:hypothetical protein
MSRRSAKLLSPSQPQSDRRCHRFKSGDLKALHLNRANLNLALSPCNNDGEDVTLSKKNSLEKHRMKNQNENSQNENQYTSGQHRQRRQCTAHRAVAKGIVAPCYTSLNPDLLHSDHRAASISSSDSEHTTRGTILRTSHRSGSALKCKVKLTVNGSEEKHMKASAPPATSQPILVPNGQTGHASRSVTERKKHPRLIGADLYVARLGWKGPSSDSPPYCTGTEHMITPSTKTPKPLEGSLHEELVNPHPVPQPVDPSSGAAKERNPSVLASRPCYRCISYMHSVGIKRVFWTTDAGIWECAKVRDLVDAMNNLGSGDGLDTAAALRNIYVTKHEVLMLRRTMGEG